uniref:HpiU3 n=1 Tax=Fischerella sp. ATCC 43239 TaxID=1535197 RepID=A0A076NA56_9CYAN|nr:HpiU3 [Fischerella sp. ATCC 43239]
MKRNLIVAAIVLLIYICSGINTPANAAVTTSIPIKNPGFEEPILKVEGDYTIDAPPGWTTYNPNGLIPEKRTKWTSNNGVGHVGPNYGQLFYNQQLPEGKNIGFIYLAQKAGSGIAGFEQTLDAVLEPNTSYKLIVDIGNFGGMFKGVSFAGFPGYRVELLAGDTVLAADHNNLYIKDGEFKTSTVTFTSAANNPYLGQKLGIRLINLLQGKFSGLDFDNVRLITETVDT